MTSRDLVAIGAIVAVICASARANDIVVEPPADIRTLAFSHDQQHLFAAGDLVESGSEKSIVWKLDCRSGKIVHIYHTGWLGQVRYLSTTPDGRLLCTDLQCRSVVFDKDGKRLNSFEQFWQIGPQPTLARFFSDDCVLIGANSPCHAFFKNDLKSNRTTVIPISGTQWGRGAATASLDGYSHAFDDGRIITVMVKGFSKNAGHFAPLKSQSVRLVSFSGDGKTLAVGYEGGVVDFADLNDFVSNSFSFKKIGDFKVDGGEITAICSFRDGYALATTTGRLITFDSRGKEKSQAKPRSV